MIETPRTIADQDLWIASDLHLESDQDATARAFEALLRSSVREGDVLVLAGDIFDAFAGTKKVFLDRFAGVIQALHEVGQRGVAIRVIEGNHDILLDAWVASIPGAQLHRDGLAVLWGDRRVWIEHGDRVDASDYGYRLLRGLFRSPLMKGIVRFSPDSLFDSFAQSASHASRKARPLLPEHLPEPERARLRRIYREAADRRLLTESDVVVYGHCHDRDEVRFDVAGRAVQYINMGFPPEHGTILRGRAGQPFLERASLLREAAP